MVIETINMDEVMTKTKVLGKRKFNIGLSGKLKCGKKLQRVEQISPAAWLCSNCSINGGHCHDFA